MYNREKEIDGAKDNGMGKDCIEIWNRVGMGTAWFEGQHSQGRDKAERGTYGDWEVWQPTSFRKVDWGSSIQ